MSKHTPGPWSISTWHNHEADIHGFDICAAGKYLLPLNTETGDGEEAAANALLMAAAPDLLSALQQIQAACAQAPWFAVTHTSPQMDAARAAIAKATGAAQ